MSDQNNFQGKRILVVEDDYLVVADLVETLYAMGADVVGPIANIEKAFERLEKLKGFGGAVLDVNVQGRMIFPLADELARLDIPFVFATGYDNSVMPQTYGHIPRFSKPADSQEIASTLLNASRAKDVATG